MMGRRTTLTKETFERILDTATTPDCALSQKAIGAKFGVSSVTVWRILNGKHCLAGHSVGDEGRPADLGEPDADVARDELHREDPAQQTGVAESIPAPAGAGADDPPPAQSDLTPCPKENPVSLADIAIAAEKFGFYTITDKATRHTRWGISCADCKAESTKGWPPSTSPELMVKNMRAIGWDISRHNAPICADCLRRHTRGPARVAPPLTVVGNEGGGGPNIGTDQTPFPPVLDAVELAPKPVPVKTQRRVFAFLEAYFDDKSRLYRGGYTDDRIALECETDAAVVVGIREEAFGTLAEPPEWMQLRTDMITVSHDIDVLESALLDHISSVVDPLKKRLQKMQDRLNAVTNKGTQG